MQTVKFECDCDRVIEMDEMGIGVGEIVQYARVFGREQLLALIDGLESIVESLEDEEEEIE